METRKSSQIAATANGLFGAGLAIGLLAGAMAGAGALWLRWTARKMRSEEYDRGWLDGVTGRPPAHTHAEP